MAINKETQDLLVESIEFYLDGITASLKDDDCKDIDKMRKIVKLDDLRKSIVAKPSE